MGSHSSRITNYTCYTLGDMLDVRLRLYTSTTAGMSICIRYSSSKVTLFHTLIINLYNFIPYMGGR